MQLCECHLISYTTIQWQLQQHAADLVILSTVWRKVCRQQTQVSDDVMRAPNKTQFYASGGRWEVVASPYKCAVVTSHESLDVTAGRDVE